MGRKVQRQASRCFRARLRWWAPASSSVPRRCRRRGAGRRAGTVEDVSAVDIVVKGRTASSAPTTVIKFRSDQPGDQLHKARRRHGEKVAKGQVIADGPRRTRADRPREEPPVAYMPWEGHNYEDAIIISERLVKDAVLTSTTSRSTRSDARDTKLGAEEITRDIPMSPRRSSRTSTSGDRPHRRRGQPGRLLVGKVTPKGETELTPRSGSSVRSSGKGA